MSSCTNCPLGSNCDRPNQSYVGRGGLGVLVIGDAPDLTQDSSGLDSGMNYMFLKRVFKEIGVDIQADIWYTTALGCYNGSNKKQQKVPTHAEIKACTPRLGGIIDKLNPKVVILLGDTPFEALIAPRIKGRLTGTKSDAFRGDKIPDQEMLKWLCPTWDLRDLFNTKTYQDGHISKPLYERDKAIYKQFRIHLFEALNLYNVSVEKIDYTSMCHITEDVDVANGWLIEAMSWDEAAWDVEANAKKLHRKGSKVYYTSISNGEVSYAFPMFDDPVFLRMWKRLMRSSIGKIAHNLQYENEAMKNCYGYWVSNWVWDTMLAAHVEHNQKRTGLKYQVLREFGVIGYDDNAHAYITKTDEDESIYGDNCFNRIADAPVKEILLYNALDSLFTFKLYKTQLSRLTQGQVYSARFYTKTAETMSKVTNAGYPVNEKGFNKAEEVIKGIMDEAEKKIMSSEEVAKWDREEPFNFQSTQQLAHLLFDILGYTPLSYTDKGAPSLAKDTIDKMDVPFLEHIIEYREAAKLYATYVEGWRREAVDGRVHSQFMLNTTDTGRSCVAKGTKILVARDFVSSPKGIPIEEVVEGDIVYTYDDNLNLTMRPVKWAGKTGHKEVIRVHFSKGTGRSYKEDYIDVTPEHLIRTATGEYVGAQNILGMNTVNNHAIIRIEYIGDIVDVYDLEVEETHNFIANGICVHNSSVSPNSQNTPKRSKEAKKLARTPVVAPDGYRIVEMDFKGQETYTNMFYSGDPAYKLYLTDKTADMHKRLASKLLLMSEPEITKEWRQQVKSQLFALTYGSYYVLIAKAMWEWLQKQHDLLAHLASKGITTYEKYEKICADAERYLWTEMFGVHDQWRKNQWALYQKQGYLDYFTGFRIEAPMDRKCTFNYPPQGSGAQITFWVMNHLQDKIDELELKTRIIGTIHDSIILLVPVEEEAVIDHWTYQFACVEIQKDWTWISLPLVMEKERSAIGGTWAEMVECGVLNGGLVEPKTA